MHKIELTSFRKLYTTLHLGLQHQPGFSHRCTTTPMQEGFAPSMLKLELRLNKGQQ